MVDSVNMPADVTNFLKVQFNPDALRRFLSDLLNRIANLEKDNTDLKARVKALEDAP